MSSSTEGSLYQPIVIEDKQGFWRRILIVDDDNDTTTTFRAGIEENYHNNGANKKIEVHTSNDPVVALSEFQISMIFCWWTLICHI